MSEKLLPTTQSASILALSASAANASAALLEPVAGSYRLIGWETMIHNGEEDAFSLPGVLAGESGRTDSPTYAGKNASSLPGALARVSQTLGDRLGRDLWDASQNCPRTRTADPALELALGQVVAALDPLPSLRVWIGGLTGHESLAAAQYALDSTVCRPVAVYRFGMGGGPDRLAADMSDARPDLAVVVGGYDQPAPSARSAVLELCEEVALALHALPSALRPALYFAGNRWAAADALALWSALPAAPTADAVENVAPAPGVYRATPLSVAASRLYWRRCGATAAAHTISRWITPPSEVRSISWSFAQAVRLWRQVHSLSALHGLFCVGPLWVHVWAAAGEDGVRLRFVPAHTRPPALDGWPPLRLVSGPWPEQLWPRPRNHWWDAAGLTPTVANVGQIDPLIAWQVLAHDLLREG
ncbi:MAG: hypothetical protein DWI57_09775 [Chloroflexi bacterium]|nr:MAG: hypothetical protein DWI57_09775 [Chloroflexota bacterium]